MESLTGFEYETSVSSNGYKYLTVNFHHIVRFSMN